MTTLIPSADFRYRPTSFGASMGKPLRLDWIADGQYDATILVMTDRDLWATAWDAEVPEQWEPTP